MKSIIALPFSWDDCPSAWKNFFNIELVGGPPDENGDVALEYINQKVNYCGPKGHAASCISDTSRCQSIAWHS